MVAVRHKPLYAHCTDCPESRRPALVFWQGRWVCANCRHDAQGRAGPRGRCTVCWRDGLPLQRHHPGRALWHPRHVELVCRSCHLVLSAMQKSVSRWDERQAFHDLQDRLDVDHGWRELAQGFYESAQAYYESRALFDPGWQPQEEDLYYLVPLGPPIAHVQEGGSS